MTARRLLPSTLTCLAAADTNDGRRTLVRPTRAAARRIRQRAKSPYKPMLVEALGTADADVVEEVSAALEILVARLVPGTTAPDTMVSRAKRATGTK